MIAIVDLGIGNLSNVEKVLKGSITDDPYEIERAEKVVVPGVGNFETIKEEVAPLQGVIMDNIDEGKPYLGICLGMQLLFGYNEEGKTRGLDVLEGDVKKLPGGGSPHIGWNTVRFTSDSPLFEGINGDPFFYFVHSYYVDTNGIVIGETELDRSEELMTIPTAINKENVFGTQFHPEKSGEVGIKLLKNFKNMRDDAL